MIPTIRTRGAGPRAFLYILLLAFNALLWLLLAAFQWQISLRAREIEYFGQQLFPATSQVVPLPVIYAVCALLSLASIGAIILDRSNLAMREKIRTLLARILESLDIGVIVLDRKGLPTLMNESARRLLPDIPVDPPNLHILTALKDHPKVLEIVSAAVENGKFVKELEQNLETANGLCPVRITTLPLKDRHKKVSGTLLLLNDISEVADMERQMLTAERLSALGTLAAALAHEIRNPLEAMNLNLELLARSMDSADPSIPADDRQAKYLSVLEDELSRLAVTVDSFLSFARPGHDVIEKLSLGEILRAVVELLDSQAKSRGVQVEFKHDAQPIMIEGSEDRLKQVFLNLMINSLEAMPAGGRLKIHAEMPGTQDAEFSLPTAVVRIQDTGEGIPAESLGRLFDPFFSTRPRGTGLGLSIVHRVIQEHRGRIRVDSTVGKGSTFTVELPALAPDS